MAELTKVRLDKWLWAARFFKTRSMAKQAIEGGKVHCNGARSKSSREIEAGFILEIRRGLDELTVTVSALSDKRGSAPQAALLYEETSESIEKRLLQAEQRKMQRAMNPLASGRPSKQDRRQIHRFIRKNTES
ncbi:MAG: ribosome-associated heat shock protein Hsp15 [Pseudohongiellaceae bacterium]|jgi:ribosome-associated heat shock protein Hsp15|tara:strand:+ start:3886 stop:4284 length:399 start_codon:yes stop_codon:yes gene_type:complete